MSIEEIYQQYANEHDDALITDEAEAALAAVDDNERLFDLLADGMESKARAGFIAGFRLASQLQQEVRA